MLVYEVMCTCGFKFFGTFVGIFEMYEFSATIFIKVSFIKLLMRSFYGKKLVAYGFYS